MEIRELGIAVESIGVWMMKGWIHGFHLFPPGYGSNTIGRGRLCELDIVANLPALRFPVHLSRRPWPDPMTSTIEKLDGNTRRQTAIQRMECCHRDCEGYMACVGQPRQGE